MATRTVPGRVTRRHTYLSDTLRADLAALDQAPRALLTLRGWASEEPDLAGLGSFEALRAVAHAGHDPDRTDRVLAALARLGSIYGAADPLASRVLLALLAPGLAAWGRRLEDLDALDGADEVDQALAAEVAMRIRTWRGHRAVAANLLRSAARDVSARLRRDRDHDKQLGGIHLSLDTVVDVDWDAPVGAAAGDDQTRASRQLGAGTRWLTAAADEPGAGVVDEVADLFGWAIRQGRLTAGEVSLIRARRLHGFADDELAAAAGVDRRTLQRRAQRAEARLRDAATEWARTA